MKKTYLNTYGKYVEILPKFKKFIKTIIEKHISLTDKEILDIGCGTGNIGFHIGSLVKTFTGIDPNENSIKIANKNKINFNKNLTFKVGSFENIPLNKKFDIVYFLL
ncbi:MAG: class I SAM-dependent methyltransferase, partial [Candidatus Woesearchaeota archaeon]